MQEYLTPKNIVLELDKYIIGQTQAKKSVAIALRNRYRRMNVQTDIKHEINPKNILMIGPTGVGKTEIARRLAKLSNAPFIKVEATKFTEIGYVGRDVESIIRDLAEISYKMIKEEHLKKNEGKAQELAENRILKALVPVPDNQDTLSPDYLATLEMFRKKLRNHELDDKEIEIDIASNIGVEIMAPPGMEEMSSQLQNMIQSLSQDRKKKKKFKVKDALKFVTEEESNTLVSDEELKSIALDRMQQSGIVFIDEIDKITQNNGRSGADVSREGVQRDLLPLIEGCTVSTKYGMVKTDHILFITSGAFHFSKPSDLVPELQGRLPIRVELQALKPEDFIRILVEPNASLIKQYQALLATENINLTITDEAIARIANLAWHINEKTENIGARRLHTVLERLLEKISFEADSLENKDVIIDEAYVNEQLQDLSMNEDLSRFIL